MLKCQTTQFRKLMLNGNKLMSFVNEIIRQNTFSKNILLETLEKYTTKI